METDKDFLKKIQCSIYKYYNLHLLKIKSFSKKKNTRKLKGKITKYDKILTKNSPEKGFESRIYRTQINLIKAWLETKQQQQKKREWQKACGRVFNSNLSLGKDKLKPQWDLQCLKLSYC